MAIELIGNSLRINNWFTEAEDTVNYFRQIPPDSYEDAFNRAVKIGVLALRDTELHAKVDFVEKTFNNLKNQLEKEFDERIENIINKLDEVFKDETGKLPKVMQEYLGQGGNLYKLLVDPVNNQSAISQIESLMKKHLVGRDSSIYKIMDHNDEQSPLKALRQKIEEAISWARDKVIGADAAKEVYELGTQHGRDYEDLVFNLKIEPLAKTFGDEAQYTKNTGGSLGPKAIIGDAVVILNPKYSSGVNAKIVFEMKDKSLTSPELLRELEQAKRNRDAIAAIAVFKKVEDMPVSARIFAEFPGNCFSCWYDPDSTEQYTIEFAYRIARFNIIKESLTVASKTIDFKNIMDLFTQFRSDMKIFSNIKTKITQTKGALDTINNEVEELENKLKETLKKIDTVLLQ